nr:MAG TPA: LysW biosynthesis protein LysW [Caudoviricetes sp.]
MKCKICGKRFKLMKENRYLATEKIAAFGTLTKLPKVFEAFDCPHCGCQNIVNTREGEATKSEVENETD